MIFLATLDNGIGTPPDPEGFIRLFGQIAKNLKGNNLFLFGQGLVLLFGLVFIPIWLHGVLSDGYIIFILTLFFLFIFVSPMVVMLDIHSKKRK